MTKKTSRMWRCFVVALITVGLTFIAGMLQTALAATPPPAEDPALAAWAVQRVKERPPLPPPGTRSQPQGALEINPALATRKMLTANLAAMPVKETLTAAQPLAAAADNMVYAIDFIASDGSRQQFAAQYRPDDSRPFYWRASGYAPVTGVDFEQARATLIKRVLNGSTEGLRVSGGRAPIDFSATKVFNWREEVQAPWTRAWLFLIDDAPAIEWEHPCRYVFLAEDLSAFAVRYERTPLRVVPAGCDQTQAAPLDVLVPHPAVDRATQSSAATALDNQSISTRLAMNYAGSAQNCYAVLLSGGADRDNNHRRYWNNTAALYDTLISKYGYPKDHIYVLMSDGYNSANDRNMDTTPTTYTNSNPDLDNDGVDDLAGSCTFSNVEAVFTELAGILTTNDQLFIWATDHGGQEVGHDAVIWLWNWEALRDNELFDMCVNLPCPIIVSLGTCHAGGFVDDMTNLNECVILTACGWDEGAAAGSTSPEYTQWLYYSTAALRGFYPGAHPWSDGVACDAEADDTGDNRVSFHEDWHHAWDYHNAGDVPQYAETAAGLGDDLFANHLYIALANNAPVTYSEIPKDFSFRVRDHAWAGVAIAPTTNHNLSCDDDRRIRSPYQSSTYTGTTQDFVVVNGHLWGNATHYAKVYSGADSSYTIEAEWEANDLTNGVAVSGTASVGEVIDMYEVSLTAGNSYEITLNITNGSGDVAMFLFRPTSTTSKRSLAYLSADASGGGGDESMLFVAPEFGIYGLAVINKNNLLAKYSLLADEADPLSAPTGLDAGDGDDTNFIHVSWNTVSGATHYRLYRHTTTNSASATAITSWTSGLTEYDDGSVSVGRTYYYWVKAAAGSDGLRESSFSAVNGGYVEPPTLASDGEVIVTNSPDYYRFSDTYGMWWAIGVRALATNDNWSLQVYTTPGFVTQLEASAYSMPVDFVVGDNHHLAYAVRGAKPYRVSGVGGATIEFEGYNETLNVGTNSSSWPAGDVVEMWDAHLTSGTYRFTLDITSGVADLDVALFGSQDGDYAKNRGAYLARSTHSGAGVDESFTYTVTNTDDFGLCVWANDTNSAGFRIIIYPLQAGLWEGDISTDWHTAGNWNDGYVPNEADDVTIPTGAPRFPVVRTNDAVCNSLTIESSASLTVSNRQLVIDADLVVHGQLNLSTSAFCKVYVGDDIYWEEGSTASVIGDAEIYISGDWNFEEGAQARLTSGYVEFQGSGFSWVRVYSATCQFYNVRSDKTNSGFLAFSPLSEASTHIQNLYLYSNSAVNGYSPEPVVIHGFFNNMGGNFHFYNGPLVYEGSPLVPLKPNVGNYIQSLVMSGPGTLSLSNAYADKLIVQDDLRIESGALNSRGLRIQVGGDWSNAVGHAGFIAGTGTVEFTGSACNLYGDTTFYNLEDHTHTGTMHIWKSADVTASCTVTGHTIVHGSLDVNGELDLNNVASMIEVPTGGVVTASSLDLGGSLFIAGGSFSCDDIVDAGLDGVITVSGGNAALRQGTNAFLDLLGDLNVSGGTLQLLGGWSTAFWPNTQPASLTVSGGTLEVPDSAVNIRNAAGVAFTSTVSSGTMRFNKSLVISRSDFHPTGGAVAFSGTSSSLLSVNPTSYLHHLVVEKSFATLQAGSDLDIHGDVEIRSGILDAPSLIEVQGSWSNAVGSAGFEEGSGTVRFYGASSSQIQSDEVFYNLELDKTYASFNGLEIATGRTLRVLNQLSLIDGALEMNAFNTLDVDHDVLIANGAGLNANDSGHPLIYVGGMWSNANTGFSTLYGFDPGSQSRVIFDGRAVMEGLFTAAASETFNEITVDRMEGALVAHGNILARGALRVANGEWKYSGGPYTHTARGNFSVDAGGVWNDNTGTLRFDGSALQTISYLSASGSLHNIEVAKNYGEDTFPLRLATDIQLMNTGSLTIEQGLVDLEGHLARCTGDVTVETNGTLVVDNGATLEVGSARTLQVQSGGVLDVRGSAGTPARITHYSGNHGFVVQSGGTIRADHAMFEYMDSNGLLIDGGAIVEEPNTFHDCVFRNGAADGTLLDLENSQALTIRNAVFPTNAGGVVSNVRKTSSIGSADFVHATGSFAGEAYDSDSFNLIDWHSGDLMSLSLAGPSVATLGGRYFFTATASGDVPLTPITYSWTMTDQSPATHCHDSLTDTVTNCAWVSSGSKTVMVNASNELGAVQADMSVDVQVLTLDDHVGFHWVGTTNAVDMVLQGTSSNSTYRVQYRTNMITGVWTNAAPGGLTVSGRNGSTPWTDMGGPARNVTTATTLFYRAVLLP
jgi:hypothetical protein